jgi:hypothetical protein
MPVSIATERSTAFWGRRAEGKPTRRKISMPVEAEDRLEEIMPTNTQYGKNEATLQRYLGYHREIQGLIRKEKSNER